jgi:hypothetical protein
MKKIILTMLTAALMVTVLAGCSGAASGTAVEDQEALWTIALESGDGTIEFTYIDAGRLEMVEVEAVKKKKDGSEETQNWEGILVSDVLESKGVSDYNLVKIEASDGYSMEFDAAAINDSGTIFGFRVDGEDIDPEDGPVQLVVKTMESKAWIKNVAKITILE